MKDFAEAINKVSPQSILHTALPMPKMDFVSELTSTKVVQPKNVLSISDVINMSKNLSDFKKNLSIFTEDNIETIENLAMGQSEKGNWFKYFKCLITASNGHEVVTKITKVENDFDSAVNMWSLKQKMSGLAFVKPSIPTLKYDGDIEIEAANTFIEFIKGKQKDIKLSYCGLFLDKTLSYVDGSSYRILPCSCCEKACVKIKCPYSINCTKPCYYNLEYL